MGLYRYSNEYGKYAKVPEYYKKADEGSKDYEKSGSDEYYPKDDGSKEYKKYPDYAEHHQKDDKGSKGCECEKDFCDSESAKALKKILSLLDDLNNQDLKILKELIERLLCSRPKVY